MLQQTIIDLALAASRAILPSNSGMFYVQLGIDTPAMQASTAFDTVSPMTRLPVPECELCFPVDEGGSTLEPNHSSAFTLLSSGDPMCSPPLGISIPLSNGSCDYNLGYSKGFFGTDTLSYSVDDAAAFEVSLNFSIGCGLFNQLAFGGDDESGNPISGVMGWD
ncbi:protein ASPARTIC PROTEASE IN GUARD CELL 2-like [Rosa rugosa]|uniref:protein ASPARTIC PROTEASE IN GUARD CELL 2-like n=1 Tax=Rosa rugosa TaxID=74645 RepID=UPI002B40374C|nr:protein ASPARTIC PROTEASE IN GUARD CELL 2-like [Rosa rugosa]